MRTTGISHQNHLLMYGSGSVPQPQHPVGQVVPLRQSPDEAFDQYVRVDVIRPDLPENLEIDKLPFGLSLLEKRATFKYLAPDAAHIWVEFLENPQFSADPTALQKKIIRSASNKSIDFRKFDAHSPIRGLKAVELEKRGNFFVSQVEGFKNHSLYRLKVVYPNGHQKYVQAPDSSYLPLGPKGWSQAVDISKAATIQKPTFPNHHIVSKEIDIATATSEGTLAAFNQKLEILLALKETDTKAFQAQFSTQFGGINTFQLMPVNEINDNGHLKPWMYAPSSHRASVSAHLGTVEDYINLCRLASELGVKVIQDIVLYQDPDHNPSGQLNGKGWNWQEKLFGNRARYSHDHMPEQIANIGRFFLTLGASGLRVDHISGVTPHGEIPQHHDGIDLKALKFIRNKIHQFFPEAFVIGELQAEPDHSKPGGGRFSEADSVRPVQEGLMDRQITMDGSFQDLQTLGLKAVSELFGPESQYKQLELQSHDGKASQIHDYMDPFLKIGGGTSLLLRDIAYGLNINSDASESELSKHQTRLYSLTRGFQKTRNKAFLQAQRSQQQPPVTPQLWDLNGSAFKSAVINKMPAADTAWRRQASRLLIHSFYPGTPMIGDNSLKSQPYRASFHPDREENGAKLCETISTSRGYDVCSPDLLPMSTIQHEEDFLESVDLGHQQLSAKALEVRLGTPAIANGNSDPQHLMQFSLNSQGDQGVAVVARREQTGKNASHAVLVYNASNQPQTVSTKDLAQNIQHQWKNTSAKSSLTRALDSEDMAFNGHGSSTPEQIVLNAFSRQSIELAPWQSVVYTSI